MSSESPAKRRARSNHELAIDLSDVICVSWSNCPMDIVSDMRGLCTTSPLRPIVVEMNEVLAQLWESEDPVTQAFNKRTGSGSITEWFTWLAATADKFAVAADLYEDDPPRFRRLALLARQAAATTQDWESSDEEEEDDE